MIITEIQTYVNYLSRTGSEAEYSSYSLFDFDSKDVVSGYGVRYGRLEDMLADLKANKLSTLHIVLNETDARGRKSANILCPRVLCLDIDTLTSLDALNLIRQTYSPSLIVESSPEKYHLYWKISPTVSLTDWSKYQLALAHELGGDTNLASITKTIRVPGVPRRTKTGVLYTPRIVYLAQTPLVLDYSNIVDVFPWLVSAYEQALKVRKREFKKFKRALKAYKNTPGEHKLSSAKPGERNNLLYFAVKDWVSSQNVSGDYLDATSTYAGEVNLLFNPSLDAAEVSKTAKSAYEHGLISRERRTKKLKELEERQMEVLNKIDVSVEVNGVPKPFEYDYTDRALALCRFGDFAFMARVRQRFGHLLVKVDIIFYAFNEQTHTWKKQDSHDYEQLFSYFRACAYDILNDPEFIDSHCRKANGEISASLMKKAKERFTSIRLYTLLLNALRNDKEITHLDHNQFDSVDTVLGTANGALDMKTFECRDIKSTDYLLCRTPIIWDASAQCPWWLNFLNEIFNKNIEMISFLQEVFGYSLCGDIREQKIFCHCGDGSNGKSKVLQALAMVGGDYATYIDPDDVVREKTGFLRPLERIGAKIEGHRIAIIDDIGVKTVWNEAFIKGVTSPQMRARGEYERSRVFHNRCKIHLGLNVIPIPDTENFGILRRLCFIDYPMTFEPDAEKSDEIDLQMQKESSGILAWALEGYRRIVSRGRLLYPDFVDLATKQYQQDCFTVEGAIRTLFEPVNEETPNNVVQWHFVGDLVDDVNKYMSEEGMVERLNADDLKKALKRIFKMESQKKWCPKRKNAYWAYNLVLRFERQGGVEFL